MELKVWNQEGEIYDATYFILNKFNNTFYKFRVQLEFTPKVIKAYVSAASGRKRKDLEIFEPKLTKADGGIKAIMWLKQQLDALPEFIESQYRVEDSRMYICIGWVDGQRRRVYSRLQKEGYKILHDAGKLVLMKEIIY